MSDEPFRTDPSTPWPLRRHHHGMARAAVLLMIITLLALGSPLSELLDAAVAQPEPPLMPGEPEIKALAKAWPERIAEIGLRDGDWMLRVDDAWFAWAHGRLLPEAERARYEEFAALAFYSYPLALPQLPTIDDEGAARLRRRVREDEENPPRRSEVFLGALLRAGSRVQTEARMLKIEVAGYTVTVHESIRDPLLRVSDELRALRRADPTVDVFLRGLREINGYNYRYVEGTRSRSYHSYGLALDLIPRGYGGRQPYWMWAAAEFEDWWAVPYEKRWMVPAPIVEAFERHGFIWGGKWLFFDTMHFEYRPEILALARGRNSSR